MQPTLRAPYSLLAALGAASSSLADVARSAPAVASPTQRAAADEMLLLPAMFIIGSKDNVQRLPASRVPLGPRPGAPRTLLAGVETRF